VERVGLDEMHGLRISLRGHHVAYFHRHAGTIAIRLAASRGASLTQSRNAAVKLGLCHSFA
jgi:hypothetical protein